MNARETIAVDGPRLAANDDRPASPGLHDFLGAVRAGVGAAVAATNRLHEGVADFLVVLGDAETAAPMDRGRAVVALVERWGVVRHEVAVADEAIDELDVAFEKAAELDELMGGGTLHLGAVVAHALRLPPEDRRRLYGMLAHDPACAVRGEGGDNGAQRPQHDAAPRET